MINMLKCHTQIIANLQVLNHWLLVQIYRIGSNYLIILKMHANIPHKKTINAYENEVMNKGK